MRTFTTLALATALVAPAAVGARHLLKPLPAGLDVRGPRRAGQVQLLADLTFQKQGKSCSDQQIFTAIEGLIERAQKFLVLDMFLFNADYDRSLGTYPALSQRLTRALLAKRKSSPEVEILLLTDSLNTFYGSTPQQHFEALRAAGVQVLETELSPLRDSNPLYSGFYRTYLRHLPQLPGALPNIMTPGVPRASLDSYLQLFNFKANHRKVALNEREALISSANPHDASAPNSNLGFYVTGAVLSDLLASERAVFEISGGSRSVFDRLAEQLEPVGNLTGAATSGEAAVQLLTEGGIRAAVLELLATIGAGDRVLVGMFYLSERRIITALKAAAAHGAVVQVILDQNIDAFGRKKTGLPAKPVAAELIVAGVAVRWYETHGEQFHPKYLAVFTADSFDIIAGSGNFTRRNICSYNLETSLRVSTPAGSALAGEVAGLWHRMWGNEGALFTSAYEHHALARGFMGGLQTIAYRLQEATGLSTF